MTLLGLALFKTDHSSAWGLRHYVCGMQKKSDSRDVLSVRCPTCGVPTGVRSKLSIGSPRITPHRDRRWVANDLTGQRPARTMRKTNQNSPPPPKLAAIAEGDEAN